MLTFNPVTKCETGVIGAESFTQHLPLELNHWIQHGRILDLSGRNHDAAVHEVSDGVVQIFGGLGQEGFQTEHLSGAVKLLIHLYYTKWGCVSSLLMLHIAEVLSLSHPVGHQSTHGAAALVVVHPVLAGPHQDKDEADRDRRLQSRGHHHGVLQPDKSHHWFLQEVQDT